MLLLGHSYAMLFGYGNGYGYDTDMDTKIWLN